MTALCAGDRWCCCLFSLDYWRLCLASTLSLERAPRAENHVYRKYIRVVSVYDGDTFTAAMVGDNNVVMRKRCRCAGYDSPEMRTKNESEKTRAVAARDFLKAYLPTHVFRVDIVGLDKYGRLLVRVSGPDGASLASVMIENGHGQPYDGGCRQPK